MADISVANDARRRAHTAAASALRYARVAGVLFLISLVAGSFGEFFVPSRLIVSTDATATAHNIMASESLFRAGFAGYLVEAVCDISLTLVLYVLLLPVNRNLALLAAFFRIVATATYAFAELFYLAALLPLGGSAYLKGFTPDQLNALALLSLRFYGDGAQLFIVFYGLGSIVNGYLMFRSGYFPRTLGVLLALGGLGFVARNFALVVAPGSASAFFLLPTVLAALAMTVWLLIKGVDVPKFAEKAAGSVLVPAGRQ